MACATGPRAALAIEGATVYASLGFPSRRLQAIDLLGGNLVWEQDLPQVAYSPPAVGSGLVVAGTDNGTYEARAVADGAVRWSYPTTGRVLLSAPMLTGDSVFQLPPPWLYSITGVPNVPEPPLKVVTSTYIPLNVVVATPT